MKKIITYLRTLVFFGALINATTSTGQINTCNVSLTYTINANGQVCFTPITAQTLGSVTWNWGDGTYTYTTGAGPVCNTYSANGIYTITFAGVNTAFTCTSVVTQTINANTSTIIPCSVLSAFSSASTTPTSFNFNSTSTGTSATSSYTWNYGDGGTGSGANSTHVYSTDGVYTVSLTVNEATPGSCTNTSVGSVTVCTATNDFTFSSSPNGVVVFTSATPTTSTSNYYWTYGDGAWYSGGANASAPTHTYLANGTYTVIMTYQSTYGCSVVVQHTVTVSSVTVANNVCALNASFNYSAVTNNFINFTNTSTGTVVGVSYLWDFGDATTSTTVNPTHTYASPGNYNVTLIANNNFTYTCKDTTNMNVTIANQSTVSVGINNISANAVLFNVSPNPNNGSFHLQLAGIAKGIISIKIYNLVGQEVYATEAEPLNEIVAKDVQLNAIANGVYFIKADTGGQVLNKKIIITRN